MIVVHVEASRLGEANGDLPVSVAVARRHDLAHALDAPLGVGESAVLLQERRSWQEHVRVVRGLVQKEVVDDRRIPSPISAATTWVVLGSDWRMSSPCT